MQSQTNHYRKPGDIAKKLQQQIQRGSPLFKTKFTGRTGVANRQIEEGGGCRESITLCEISFLETPPSLPHPQKIKEENKNKKPTQNHHRKGTTRPRIGQWSKRRPFRCLQRETTFLCRVSSRPGQRLLASSKHLRRLRHFD